MNAGGRIEVVADVSRNCLRLSFVGVLTLAEMQRYEAEIARALNSLHPGFSLLSDLTDLTSMEMNSVPAIERTMELIKAAGVKLVVRVIPDPTKDIGMNIMSLFHYPHGLKIVTTETREEATKVLGRLAKT